jgi:gamma-glutamyltranspeptidase/glutathione hydrolase
MGHNSARYIHVITEALKLVFADRERYYGDSPTVPLTELLSPAYARERAALIDLKRAAPKAPAPGEVRTRWRRAASRGTGRPRRRRSMPMAPRTSRRSIATAT